jgi:hypothetical protein
VNNYSLSHSVIHCLFSRAALLTALSILFLIAFPPGQAKARPPRYGKGRARLFTLTF